MGDDLYYVTSKDTLSERLASYSLETEYDDLPKNVQERTKLTILDTVACAIAGSNEELVKKAAELAFELDSREQSSIIKHRKTSAYHAILVNSMMIQIHEYDDIALRMHPSRIIIPPALAVAEWKNISGKEFLAATAIGYEVQCLIFDMLQNFNIDLKDGALDACGGPATVSLPLMLSKLLKLTKEQTVNAIGLCSSGGYPSGEGILEWAPAEVFTCGFLGQRALTSVLLAKSGASNGYGPRAILEGPGGLFKTFTKNMDLSKAHDRLDALGNEYIMTNAFYYKLISQCRATHKAVEATLNIVKEHPITVEEIEVIDVLTLKPDVTHRFRPMTMGQATFCTPLGILSTIINGRRPMPTDLLQMNDPLIVEMMDKVRFINPLSDIRLIREPSSTIIEIYTTNGEKYVNQVVNQKGMPQDPVTDEELINKFRQLTKPIIGEDHSGKILETVLNLDKVKDINEFTKLLTD